MAEQKVKKAAKPAKVAKTTAPKSATAGATPKTEKSLKLHRRTMTGTVVSNKMMKTCVVRIERQVRDGMYGKYITKSTKFKVHDETNKAKPGDLVSIIESRPMSKEKRWALQSIIRSAKGDVLEKV